MAIKIPEPGTPEWEACRQQALASREDHDRLARALAEDALALEASLLGSMRFIPIGGNMTQSARPFNIHIFSSHWVELTQAARDFLQQQASFVHRPGGKRRAWQLYVQIFYPFPNTVDIEAKLRHWTCMFDDMPVPIDNSQLVCVSPTSADSYNPLIMCLRQEAPACCLKRSRELHEAGMKLLRESAHYSTKAADFCTSASPIVIQVSPSHREEE